jgi:5-methylcytosine-specific restriction endonuclease McrA
MAAVSSVKCDVLTRLTPGGEPGLAELTDDELLANTRRLVGKSNQLLAALLVHLAEVEARGVHRKRRCASLYTYCIYELRFSEDAAARRTFSWPRDAAKRDPREASKVPRRRGALDGEASEVPRRRGALGQGERDEVPRQRGALGQGERDEVPRQRGALDGGEPADPPRQRVSPDVCQAPETPRRRARHIPAAVRGDVYRRDGGRCAYVDAQGERCCETRYLELHHLQPFAKHGAHVAANLALRCRAHNQLAAEHDFGPELIAKKRDSLKHETLRAQIDANIER